MCGNSGLGAEEEKEEIRKSVFQLQGEDSWQEA